jgi:EmrB/QacA subfamily drug resistance transporter
MSQSDSGVVSDASEPAPGQSGAATPPDPRRWRALTVLALVQFIIVIDNTVVNVALPSVQHALHFSSDGLAWVINGYLLTAGGLLLFGGRVGDLLGRKRMFLFGTALFGLASLVCGAAPTAAVLVASRFAQGMGEAFASPAALSLIALLFTDRAERSKALGIWGALGGLGATVGVLLSGVITQLATWRWVFFINLPFALLALILLPRLVDESRAPRTKVGRNVDILGVVLITSGLSCIVDGLLAAAREPWSNPGVVFPIVIGVLALVAVVPVEARVPEPLMPLGFFTHRTRVAANVATVFMVSVLASMFLILTLYMQNILGYSPIVTGLAYLPFCLAFVPGFMISTQVMKRYGARTALLAAYITAFVGMLLLTRIEVHGAYVSTLLPAMLVLALGFGMGFPALQAAALHDVSEDDAGLASGVQTTVQALSSALGVAAFLTIALRHTGTEIGAGVTLPVAAIDGYQMAYRAMAVSFAIGVIAALFVKAGPSREDSTQTEAVAAQDA